MKIAQINPGYMSIPPNSWGAVEKIIWYYKIESENKGHDVHIRYINEIQRGEFDIVHVHMWNHALELRDKNIPYIFTCHDHHAYIFGKYSELFAKNLEAMLFSERAIVPAEYLVEYFNNVPIYLRHGIAESEYVSVETDIPHKLLCVGNNGMGGDSSFDRKGFRFAIEAANKLHIPITVVGPTNNNKAFFDSNSDLKTNNVEILYDLSDQELIDCYNQHTILVHATSVEAGHPPLTILEAASCGLPILTTDCAGKLYTTKIERDVKDIVEKIKSTISLYKLKVAKTKESIVQFYWTNVVDDLIKIYQFVGDKTMSTSAINIYNRVKKNDIDNQIIHNFVDGAFLEIRGNLNRKYNVSFFDNSDGTLIYGTESVTNTWSKTNRKWFTDWKLKVDSDNGSIEYTFDLKDKRVFIVFESSSLGDTLAWMPYVEEFRKKHNCKVILSTFHNYLFESEYAEIEFVNPGSSVENIYALYRVGVFYSEDGVDFNRHKTDFTKLSLQEIACDILGLDYEEIRPRIKHIEPMSSDKPYICIANHSTAQSKYWNNPTGWQELVDLSLIHI